MHLINHFTISKYPFCNQCTYVCMIILENIRMKISRITSQDRIETFLHSVNSFTGKFGGNLVI